MSIQRLPFQFLLLLLFALLTSLSFAGKARAQEVYVLDDGNARLYKADAAVPHALQVLSTSLGRVGGMAIDPSTGDLYYTVNSTSPMPNGALVRANSDGTNVTNIAVGLNYPTAVAIDIVNGFLYYIQREADFSTSIYRVGISGSPSPVQVVAGNPSFGPIDVDVDPVGSMIYWTDSRGSSVRRASLTGTSEVTLVDTITEQISGIAVDSTNSRVYWINDTSMAINYVDMSGSFPTSPSIALSSSLIGAGGLEVDDSVSPVSFFFANQSSIVGTGVFGGTATTLLDINDGGVASPVDLALRAIPTPTPTPTPTSSPTITPTATPISEVLSPVTVIAVPPQVEIVSQRIVRLTFQNFNTVVRSAMAKMNLGPDFLAARSKLTFRYDVRVTAPTKRDNIKKVTKNNELTLKGLKPGNYSANYSVIAYAQKTKAQREKAVQQGKSGFAAKFKKVFTTNRSPSVDFNISP